jgi:hypothetical protein
MFRAAILAAVIVCLTHALLSYPGYESVPATPAIDVLPLPADCPSGQCPVRAPVIRETMRAVAMPVVSVVEAVAHPHTRGQWSYPGDVYSHLASTHGVNASGMSLQQAESLHSSLHEQTAMVSRSYVVGQPVRNVVRFQPVRSVLRAHPVRTMLRRVFCR